ncbi:hypothetical protein C2E23DRAFT_693171, partial [Lenzites betulinus]
APDDPEEEDEDANEPVYNLEDGDPNYVPVEELFAQELPQEAHRAGGPPPALQEDPLIRRAYVQAFISAAFHGGTHDLVEHMLKSQKSNLRSLSARLDYDFPGLDDMAVTLRTVERRLGVDPDQFIQYYFHCNACWVRHPAASLYTLLHPACLEDGCSGALYTSKKLSNGKISRTPTKPLPTSSLEHNIQRMLLRPGKIDDFNAWRQGEDDQPGHKPPVSQDDWPGSLDEDYRMYDMHDGWGWNAIQGGLQRRRGGEWEVEDVDIHEREQRFVALPCGLVIIINIDWYRGKYSVGAIYATICNNPRARRFLREETVLLAIIPGPEEPSLEQMNYVLEPFVAEAHRMYKGIILTDLSYVSCAHILASGVPMHVPEKLEPLDVNVFVNILAADLPGSRKGTGLRGHTSKWHMCAVCKKPFHSLVDDSCFNPETFEYRDDGRYLKYAFRAQHEDIATREEIAERRGIRWSVLNLLPDWKPARDGPPDFMHAAYLGEAKHVVQGILVAGGMFAKRNSRDKPTEKLQKFMGEIWWPGSAGRVPASLIMKGAGKADEWRSTCAVLPVALYAAWEKDGYIPDANAPNLKASEKAGVNQQRIEHLVNERRHAHAAYTGAITEEVADYIDHTRMDRNYVRHYDTAIEWLVSLRIFGSRSISICEAYRAQAAHGRACQSWARMLCHLTPYFHIL